MRVAGYIRVSSAEQREGYSLETQEAAIRGFCEARGFDEPAIYAEPGFSAWTDEVADRPAFARLLADVEAGTVDAVVVHQIDRWARNVLVCLRELRTLERAGATFASVSEQMDFTTPFGRAALGMLAIIAQLYSDQLSQRVRQALATKAARGEHVGAVPFGAVREGGRLRVDPARADTLAYILEASQDRSLYEIAAELTRRGVPRPGGAAKAKAWARRRGEAYAGEGEGGWYPETVRTIVRGGRWLREQPEPWPSLWLAARTRRAPPPVRADRQTRMLSGLMVCACGGRLHYGGRRGPARRLTLQCARRGRDAYRAGCPFRKTYADVYEAQVTAALLALPEPEDWREEPDTRAAWAELEEDRARLAAVYRGRLIGYAEFARELAALDERERALARGPGDMAGFAEQFRALRAQWPSLSGPWQNYLLRELASAVEIEGDRARVLWRPGVRTE